ANQCDGQFLFQVGARGFEPPISKCVVCQTLFLVSKTARKNQEQSLTPSLSPSLTPSLSPSLTPSLSPSLSGHHIRAGQFRDARAAFDRDSLLFPDPRPDQPDAQRPGDLER